MKTLLISMGIAAALILGAVGLWSLRTVPPAPAAGQPSADREKQAQNILPEPKELPTVKQSLPRVTRHPRTPQSMLELPDGTFVPSLNQATNAAALAKAWHADVPFAPIVGKETASDGIEWYVHADGSRSTTRMVFRDELGRMDAVTSVAHPGGTAPKPGGRSPTKGQ